MVNTLTGIFLPKYQTHFPLFFWKIKAVQTFLLKWQEVVQTLETTFTFIMFVLTSSSSYKRQISKVCSQKLVLDYKYEN